MRRCLVIGLLALAPPAVALEQLEHWNLTAQACRDAGFPEDFCVRAGVASGNVDGHEWTVMPAHAQAAHPDAMCEGAQATLDRLQDLAAAMGPLIEDVAEAVDDEARQEAVGRLADELGRPLHTLQDLCAHQGITNPQHAWYSTSDLCAGTSLNPDAKPEAIDCARSLTREALDAFKAHLEDSGVPLARLEDITVYEGRLLPSGQETCAYLEGANDWDGADRRWRIDVMRPAALDAFEAGLTGASRVSVGCEGLMAGPVDPIDTSGGAPWCASTQAVCTAGGGGCGCAVGGFTGLTTPAILLGLAFFHRRRRSSAPS